MEITEGGLVRTYAGGSLNIMKVGESRRSKSWDIDKVGRNKTGEVGILRGFGGIKQEKMGY